MTADSYTSSSTRAALRSQIFNDYRVPRTTTHESMLLHRSLLNLISHLADEESRGHGTARIITRIYILTAAAFDLLYNLDRWLALPLAAATEDVVRLFINFTGSLVLAAAILRLEELAEVLAAMLTMCRLVSTWEGAPETLKRRGVWAKLGFKVPVPVTVQGRLGLRKHVEAEKERGLVGFNAAVGGEGKMCDDFDAWLEEGGGEGAAFVERVEEALERAGRG